MDKITNTQKKLALLYGRLEMDGAFSRKDKDTPMEIGKSERTKRDITQQKLTLWRDGTARQEGWSDLSRAVAEHYDVRTRQGNLVQYDLIGEAMGPMTFGKRLGLTRSQCQFFIDDVYARTLPTFTMFSKEEDVADRFVRDYGGLYTIYRLQQHPKRGWVVVQIPLSIRYMLASSKKRAANDYRIRCKITVPRVPDRGAPIYEYDGLVTTSNEAWYWCFEMRQRERAAKDMLFMVTNVPRPDGEREFLEGHMVTSTQSNAEAVYWPILIVRDKRYGVERGKRQARDVSHHR